MKRLLNSQNVIYLQFENTVYETNKKMGMFCCDWWLLCVIVKVDLALIQKFVNWTKQVFGCMFMILFCYLKLCPNLA